MITRRQTYIIALWIGIPFIIFLWLLLTNFNYEGILFERTRGFFGIEIFMGLEALNFLVLYFGFRSLNRSYDDERATRRGWVIVLHSIVTFVLLTVPAIWMAALFPSVVILVRMGNMP